MFKSKKDKKLKKAKGKDKRPSSTNISANQSKSNLTNSNGGSNEGNGSPVPSAAQQRADKAKLQAEKVEGLVFTGEMKDNTPVVKGGTIQALVHRLTYEKYADLAFLKAFMLTYRSFTTPLELLAEIKKRYLISPPEGSSAKQSEEFISTVQRPIRLRVYNTLKYWIQKGFYDFMDDEQLASELQDFIKNTMASTGMENPAKQLQKIFDRHASGQESAKAVMFSAKPPPPHLPQNCSNRKLTLMDFHPEEIARQLTLIEYELYKNIKPWECLNQSWAKKNKETNAPNILAMIQRFNQVSNWCATEIVQKENLKERAAVLKHIIEIAEYCKKINNFNAMMEIISGLQNSAVYRLKLTWAEIGTKYNKSYNSMHAIMSREQNYKNARAFLHNVDPPCIPYLGVYLTDLTFIEDGNPDDLPDGKINFVKRQRVSEVISEIQQYQNTPYCLEVVTFIREYLAAVESLDENSCYKLSLLREARNGKVDSKKPAKGSTGATAAPAEEKYDPNNPFGDLEVKADYPFEEPDTDKNILFDKSTDSALAPIKGGTFIKLVERVTYDKYPDMNYLLAFLMCYRTFATPAELMDLLNKRFHMPQPKAPTQAQMNRFKTKRMIPIHLRIFNVIKFWIDRYGIDFIEDPDLTKNVLGLVEEAMQVNSILAKPGEQIKKIIERKIEQGFTVTAKTIIGQNFSGSSYGRVTDFDPEQVAFSIILMNQEIFKDIDGRECLSGVWEGKQAEEMCPNILRLRQNFKTLKRFVNTEILKSAEPQERAIVVSHWVRIAEILYKWRDFTALVAVVNAMMQAKWLLPTWEWVPQQLLLSYQQIQALVKAPKKLKEKEKSQEDGSIPGPIPYLEVYLRQLSGIYDMLPDNIAGSLINFEKRRKVYDVFLGWQTAQSHPYEMPEVPDVKQFLESAEVWTNVQIKSVSSKIQNAAPSARLEMSHLPNPEKRAEEEKVRLLTNEDGEVIDNSEMSEVDQTEKVSEIIVDILTEEPDFLASIIAEQTTELRKELVAGFKAHTNGVQDELIVLNGSYGLVDPASLKQASKRIVERIFPGTAVTEWSGLDSQGVVFGWQEEVYLFIVTVDEQRKLLVHVAGKVDGSGLGVVLRTLSLYNAATKDTNYSMVIVSPSVSPAAATTAKERNIQIMAF